MTSKKHKKLIRRLKAILPYFLAGGFIIGLVAIGSFDKQSSGINLSLSAFAESDYKVSVDQMSAMYVVADLSDALNLASAQDVASNYVIVTSMRSAGQTASGKIVKPTITNVVVSRGVIKHTVVEGETMESIAKKYTRESGEAISTDQIRWSNGKKTTDIEGGEILYIPSKSGIVYTVKSGNTIAGIAEKYGSSEAEITALNDLEVSGISEGMRIFIHNGTLPETERPEYVPPRRVAPTTTYTYTYLGNTAQRLNIEVIGYFYGLGGPYGRGQCTQWAWYMRESIGRPIPSNLGNANTWASKAAAQGFTVVRGVPIAGAVFQSGSGWYGHVGYVESVNGDGSIVASEMNYNYVPYRAIRSIIPAATVANLNFIY